MKARAMIVVWMALACAPAAEACREGLALSQVIAEAEKTFPHHPRSTIHQCFWPYVLRGVDDEPSDATRERFLHLVVTKTALRAFLSPPREHHQRLIVAAADKYFDVFEALPDRQRDFGRYQQVLVEWGKAQLSLPKTRRGVFEETIGRYKAFGREFPQHLSLALAEQWETFLRCAADTVDCATLDRFQCVPRRACGLNETVVEFLREQPAALAEWEQLLAQLELAIQSGRTGLRSRRIAVEGLLGRARTP